MSDGSLDKAFNDWRRALQDLTSSEEGARIWRRDRYTFAHRIGQALTRPVNGSPAVSGHVVYGVWLRWGLLYLGQTAEAERRLRDLAVGESHHLANTYPPEIWHRVVVISWSKLSQASNLARELEPRVIGLALEHRLQNLLCPLANASRRTANGGWREVDRNSSRSIGALAGNQVEGLFDAVREIWLDAARSQSGTNARFDEVCRVVFPGELLQ